MSNNITLLDGALGTMLWELSGTAGEVWKLNLTHPEIVAQLHTMYIEAGAQIIASNTFSANEYAARKSGEHVAQVVAAGVKIAKSAAQGKAVKVALDIGPLPELLEPYGDLTEEECEQAYREILSAGSAQAPDLIFFETFMDVEMLKIAVKVASEYALPIFCSMTFAPMGKTMMGNSVCDMIEGLAEYDIAAIGLNCSDAPASLLRVIEEFRANTDKPLIFKPNAGLPQQQDGKDVYQSGEATFAQDMLPVLALGAVYIGGCCGTTPSHIKALKAAVQAKG
ncbi:MAG: homocysteine S-methyltransferase family protein [Faecalibacterium sp.]